MRFWITIACLFSYSALQAQLCNNNLGDPIVNVTFGIKGQPQFPNKTNFNYMDGCPTSNNYTINDFLFGCGGYWVQLTGDHTPDDLDGNYMLVNAENNPGIISIDTAKGLCSNITYQFSAFIKNVMQNKLTCPNGNPVLPNLTFNIESTSGSILATYNTGDIPITDAANWVQYGLTYTTTGTINTVVLKIIVNSRNGCGNAFAIDDIVFQSCGPTVSATIDGTTDDQNVCANYTNPFLMKGSYSSGFINPAVLWQKSLDTGKTWIDIPGTTTTSYQVPHRNSGVILYRMAVAEKANINSPNCRTHSNIIYTGIHPLPAHQQTQYVHGCTGKDLLLPDGNTNAFYLLWTGPNGYNSTDRVGAFVPNFNFADAGLYQLKQTYDYNCVDLDSFYLSASPGVTVSTQPTHALCSGESETLLITTSTNAIFEWTPSAGLSDSTVSNPVASPIDSTIYKVIVTNVSGCKDSAELPINVYKLPVVSAGNDKTILSGDTATLDGSISGTAINYSWSPSINLDDVNATRPKAYPKQDMTYTLTAASTVGCGSASDNVNVIIVHGIFIPSSFTPNGDGKNDVFRVAPFDNYKLLHFVIYNRWGAKIFNTTKAGDGWDGTYKGYPQPLGTYIYSIELEDSNKKKIIKQGTITLLR